MATTAKDIADRLYQELRNAGDRFPQREAVKVVRDEFGEDWLYTNKNGNPAIKKSILDKFRELRGNDWVWASQTQAWRKRRPDDPADKSMVRY